MADAAILPLVTAGRDRRRHVIQAAFPAQQPIRIVIADSQPLVRAGLRALLESEDDVTVVGQATDAAEATTLARETRPDVSPATAKTHVSRALCKRHTRDRAQLVRLAYETGLVVARHGVSAPSTTAMIVAA